MSWLTRQQIFSFSPNHIPYFWNTHSTSHRANSIDAKGFKVTLITNAYQKAYLEDYQRLEMDACQTIWIREVKLELLSAPVMYARLIAPYASIEKSFRRIPYLDTQPLGRYLFQIPNIIRQPYEVKLLKKEHPLYKKINCLINIDATDLWARRSIFLHNESKLLLTEVFLPQYLSVFNKKPIISSL